MFEVKYLTGTAVTIPVEMATDLPWSHSGQHVLCIGTYIVFIILEL